MRFHALGSFAVAKQSERRLPPLRSVPSFGIMNRITIDSHRSLFYALFAVFELVLLVSVAALWCIDPRRMSGLDDAVGITFWFSFFGLSVVCWLLRRVAPRMARVGLVILVGSFIAGSLLPAVP
jgi:apolipoprotein N-acyltransferase